MRRQASSVIAILVGIFLIISLSRDLQLLLSARERIEKEHKRVMNLEEEQQGLAEDLEQVISEEFIEREARDKLLMAKPGEVVVVLPAVEEATSPRKLVFEEDVEKEMANWEKWMKLFF